MNKSVALHLVPFVHFKEWMDRWIDGWIHRAYDEPANNDFQSHDQPYYTS